jgi:hypothetical protein
MINKSAPKWEVSEKTSGKLNPELIPEQTKNPQIKASLASEMLNPLVKFPDQDLMDAREGLYSDVCYFRMICSNTAVLIKNSQYQNFRTSNKTKKFYSKQVL